MRIATDALHLPVLVVVLWAGLPVPLGAAETAILRVFLNHQDKGDHAVVIDAPNEAFLRLEALRGFGLKELPLSGGAEFDGIPYVPLSSLKPGVSFRIDEIGAAIHISADPGLLGTSIIDLAAARPGDVVRGQKNSGFLNYGLYCDLTNDLEFRSLDIPVEAGVSIGGRLLSSGFFYRRHDDDRNFVRLMSSFTADKISTQRRFVVGDYTAFTGQLGGAGLFGGISVSRQFSITPWFVSSPELNLSGFLETPSAVDIYVNNQLVDTLRLPPGGFEVLNLPGSGGAGEVSMIVRDAFGVETVHAYPFYTSTSLLKAGLHEYSYNLGFERQNFGLESYDYGEPAFLGLHRFGLTDKVTLGMSGEAFGDVRNLGAESAIAFARFGELALSAAGSREHGNPGYAAGMRYTYRGAHFSGQFSIRGFSDEYAAFNRASSADRSRFDASLAFGFGSLRFGSISMQLSTVDLRTAPDRKVISLSYTRRLSRSSSLFVRASRAGNGDGYNDIEAGFTLFLGPDRTGGMNIARRGPASRAIAYLSKNLPSSAGYAYRLRVDQTEGIRGETGAKGNALFAYRGSRGAASAEYWNAGNLDHLRLGFSGAVAFINRALYLSRPITDSFAVAKVGDLEGVRVRRSNQDIGVTDENGEVFVPDLISYYENKLSFDDGDVPVHYKIDRTSLHAVTSLRSGTFVSFGIRKLQAFVGRIFVVTDAGKTPAEFWSLELDFPDGKKKITVGRNGELYLENAPPGAWTARLIAHGQECFFALSIPPSQDTVAELGEVACELD